MASEIRVNTINNRSGLGTISLTNSGAVFSGVTTFAQIKTTSGEVTVGTGASVFSPATNVLALGTNNTEKVRITSTGSVGIGTDNPQTTLHLFGSRPIIRLQDSDSTGTATLQRIEGIQTGSTQWFVGQNSTSDNELWIQNITNDDIRFGTNNTERLRITSSGNVGIGLTNPQTALVVERDWVNNYGSISIKSSSDVLSGVGFRTDGGYAGGFIYRDGTTGNFFELNAQGSREIRALLNGSEALRIDTSGRLLVGTNSASYTTTAVFEGNSFSDTGQGQIYINKGDTTVAADTTIGILRFGATGDRRGADIRGVGDGSWTADSSHPTSLLFMTTASGASSPTERMRIDSTGNIGVGGAAAVPTVSGYDGATLHLYQTNSSGAGSQLRMTNGATGHTASDGLYLAYWSDRNCYFYNREDGDIVFGVNNVEEARINSGGGISFNGDTAAANALDDYEEGTWDPSVGGTATYNSPRVGYYVKIGQLVSCYFYFQINTIGTGNTFQISGLPYTSQPTISTQGAIGYFSDLSTNVYWVGMTGGASNTTLYLRCQRALDVSVDSSVSLLTSGSAIAGSITYRASS